jgi:hypothetical protein
MDENKVAGRAKSIGGQPQEEFGRVSRRRRRSSKGLCEPHAAGSPRSLRTGTRRELAIGWRGSRSSIIVGNAPAKIHRSPTIHHRRNRSGLGLVARPDQSPILTGLGPT